MIYAYDIVVPEYVHKHGPGEGICLFPLSEILRKAVEQRDQEDRDRETWIQDVKDRLGLITVGD